MKGVRFCSRTLQSAQTKGTVERVTLRGGICVCHDQRRRRTGEQFGGQSCPPHESQHEKGDRGEGLGDRQQIKGVR
jgi:hypothetical protein